MDNARNGDPDDSALGTSDSNEYDDGFIDNRPDDEISKYGDSDMEVRANK